MRRNTNLALLIVAAALFSLCVVKPASAQDNRSVNVFVSILPHAYFVERIGGENVSVSVLVGPGQSPATYKTTPKQMARLARADILFRTGLPFENRLVSKVRGSFKNLRIVDLRQDIELRGFQDHDHGYEGHEGRSDPHTWMSPANAQVQAKTIYESLASLDRSNASAYRANWRELQKDLSQLQRSIASTLAPYRGRSILVFHPSYGYLTDAYGLNQKAVEFDGKSPGPGRLAKWIDVAREEKVGTIFVQPQFSGNEARTIADAVGANVVALDPLAKDYLANLKHVVDAIAASFQSREK